MCFRFIQLIRRLCLRILYLLQGCRQRLSLVHIHPDPHPPLVEKSSVGGRPNMDVGEGGSRSQSFAYPSLLLTALQNAHPLQFT